jgi:hypothetical protein
MSPGAYGAFFFEVTMTSYEQAARAKLQKDKASYLAFRAVDQQLHESAFKARTEAAVSLAREDLANWREDEAQVKAEADQALAAARLAEDRAVAAAEFARDAQMAYLEIKDTGSPGEVTDKLTVAQNAAGIARDRARAAEAAAKSRENTSALLVTSRGQLARAKGRMAKAQEAAKAPAGTAPVSDATIAANFPYMQRDEVWDALSRADRKRVEAAARKVRIVPMPAEEVEAFGRWLDSSMDRHYRGVAAQQARQGVPVPLV